MNKVYRILAAMLAVLAMGSQSASADVLVEKMRGHLQAVKDYKADMELSATLPQLTVRNMKMTLYYKRPDKVKVEAKEGFAAIPREGLYIGNPIDEMLRNYDLKRLAIVDWKGKKAVKYSLRPKENVASPLGNLRLYIDSAIAVPIALTGESYKGGSVTTEFFYTKVAGKYWLPSKTTLKITNLQSMPGASGSGGKAAGKPGTGNAVVVFSNYKINSGLSDSLFARPAKGSTKTK